MTLNKLVKKLRLKETDILNICAQEHLLKSVYSKADTKKVDMTFKGDSLEKILKISKTLKVSKDAVIGGILLSMIQRSKDET